MPLIFTRVLEDLPEELRELTEWSRNSPQCDQLSVKFDLCVPGKSRRKTFQFMCNASAQCGQLLLIEE